MSKSTANELLETSNDPSADDAPHAPRFGPFIGNSPEMRELFGMLRHVTPTSLALIVQGEGERRKDVARAVHLAGPRVHGPFEVLDLSTISVDPLESRLLGRVEAGGGHHAGAFERANQGTLFIDEIGELPWSLQPQILAVLERREVCPVGGTNSVPIDVRVITGTRRDLWLEVEAGRFREDLYFHLAQVRVTVPSSSLDTEVPFAVAKQKVVDRFEKEYLGQLMQQTGGNISRAAREAELARHHLRDLLKKHGLYEGGDTQSTIPPRSK